MVLFLYYPLINNKERCECMKKLILIIALVLMITSCSKSTPEENFETEELYGNNEISFDKKANNDFSLTQEEVDFWDSKYGEDILKWKSDPGYNIYFRNLENGCILYYCEGAVYVKKIDGEIVEIIDQININPEYIYFRDNCLSIPFESGSWRYGIGNFPYNYVYDIEEEKSHKEMWQLNDISRFHRVIGSKPVDGEVNNVIVNENSANIYFSINLEKQIAGLDNYFPQIDFFYNEYNQTAYFYISGIINDIEKINALEKIEGVEQLNVEVFEDRGIVSGTLISFVIKKEYELYGEVFAGFETSPDDYFKIWIVKD